MVIMFYGLFVKLINVQNYGSLYSAEYGIAELRNKQKSHSKYFVIVYSLYNILIYVPHLVENTITMAPILGAIFK